MIATRLAFFRSHPKAVLDAHGTVPDVAKRPFMQAIAPAVHALRLATVIVGLAAGVHGDMQHGVPMIDMSPTAIEHAMGGWDPHRGAEPTGWEPGPDDAPGGDTDAPDPAEPADGKWRHAMQKTNNGVPQVIIDNQALAELGLRIGEVTPDDVMRIVQASGHDVQMASAVVNKIVEAINTESGWSHHLTLGHTVGTDNVRDFPGGQLAISVSVANMSLSPEEFVLSHHGLAEAGFDATALKLTMSTAALAAIELGHEAHHGADDNIARQERVALTQSGFSLVAGPEAEPLPAMAAPAEGLSAQLALEIGNRLGNEVRAELGGALNHVLSGGEIGHVKELADIRAVKTFFSGSAAALFESDKFNGYQGVHYNLAPYLDALHAHLSSLGNGELEALKDVHQALVEGKGLSDAQRDTAAKAMFGEQGAAGLSPDQSARLDKVTLAEFQQAVLGPLVPQVAVDPQTGAVTFPGIETAKQIAKGDFSAFLAGGIAERAMEAEARIIAHAEGEPSNANVVATAQAMAPLAAMSTAYGPAAALEMYQAGVADLEAAEAYMAQKADSQSYAAAAGAPESPQPPEGPQAGVGQGHAAEAVAVRPRAPQPTPEAVPDKPAPRRFTVDMAALKAAGGAALTVPSYDRSTHLAVVSDVAVLIKTRDGGQLDNPIDYALVAANGTKAYFKDGERVDAAYGLADTLGMRR